MGGIIAKTNKFLMKKKNIPFILVPIIAVAIYIIYVKKEGFKIGSNKEVILFYLPGCVHCESLMPTWKMLETNYHDNQYVKLSAIDVKEDSALSDKYKIQSYPTILFLNNGVNMKEYTGDRTYKDLVRFLNFTISDSLF